MAYAAGAPIGVFDSGVGGLSVLRYIRAVLPHEHLIYFADSGYAPYGDRSDDAIVARSLAVAQFLMTQGIKALVVACNTATAAAIQVLRARYPALIVVGIEPGLKPAAQLSISKQVGVLATRSTLASARFIALRDTLAAASGVHFHSAACVGLADQIEQGALLAPRTSHILLQHLTTLVASQVDTLVLGCTHYPFVRPLIEDLLLRLGSSGVHIVDTGEPVSAQLVRLLERERLVNSDHAPGMPAGNIAAYTTASASNLQSAFLRLLGLTVRVTAVATPTQHVKICKD